MLETITCLSQSYRAHIRRKCSTVSSTPQCRHIGVSATPNWWRSNSKLMEQTLTCPRQRRVRTTEKRQEWQAIHATRDNPEQMDARWWHHPSVGTADSHSNFRKLRKPNQSIARASEQGRGNKAEWCRWCPSLAAASARSLPAMPLWALTHCRCTGFESFSHNSSHGCNRQ
jgi:hypothetical protein